MRTSRVTLGEGWSDSPLGARIARSPGLADVRNKLAFECGRIMALIHSIDLDATGLRDLLETSPPQSFVEQTWERYRLLEAPQPLLN